jgi:ferric iron reductase protein FhuF
VTATLTAVPAGEVADALRRAGRDNPLMGIGLEPDPDTYTAPMTGPVAVQLAAAIGGWLNTAEVRVAASLVVLGYSARLIGPAVALPLRDGVLPDLRPERVRFAYRADRGFQLYLPEPAGWRGDPAALRSRWHADIVDNHLAGLVETVRAATPVAPGLLWGNIASGVAGALRMLARTGAAPADRCLAEGLALLDHGPLRDTGDLRLTGGDLTFTRHSCCLYYRLDGGGYCGDCALS